MAASFDLEVIEISPIELGGNFGARSLFLWIMWIDPGTTASWATASWARARHMAKVVVTLISKLPMTVV
jgi:hypothetical protein